MKRSESLTALPKALAKAQKLIENAKREHTAKVQSKKGEGSSYSYNYADLAAVMDVVRDPLTDNGLSIVQIPTTDFSAEGCNVSVTSMLLHDSGEFIESDPLTLRVADAMPQTIGSGITYARRYGLTSLICVAFETDDDGAAGSGLDAQTGQREREPKPECPKCGKSEFVGVSKAEYGGGLYCWKAPERGKNGCGHKWHPNDSATQPRPNAPAGAMNGPTANGNGNKSEVDQMGEEMQSGLFAGTTATKPAATTGSVAGNAAAMQAAAAQPESAPAGAAPPPATTPPKTNGNGKKEPYSADNQPTTKEGWFEFFKGTLKQAGIITKGGAHAVIDWASNSRWKTLDEVATTDGAAEELTLGILGCNMTGDQMVDAAGKYQDAIRKGQEA